MSPKVVNVFTAELTPETGCPEGFGGAARHLGPELGAAAIGGSVYEIPPGKKLFPYHYEHGDEEWLVVLAGTPGLRHPGGEDVLAPGDAVAFPAGPKGAHQLINRSNEPTRVLMLSTMNQPKVIVYPDSDKVGVRVADRSDNANLPQSAAVDYWEGE